MFWRLCMDSAMFWFFNNCVSNMRTSVCERVLEEVPRSVPPRTDEWVEVVVCPVLIKGNLLSFISSPWMKWYPANYRVQKGSRLLCSPPPRKLGGSVPSPRGEVWFSQSQSSRLWPVRYGHERTTRNCRWPGKHTERHRDEWDENTGNK